MISYILIFFFPKGKLEALAILLQKLRSENRRVLIFTQMVKMLDILEAFLDYRQLTYVRVDESFTQDERQVKSSPPTETINAILKFSPSPGLYY